VADQKTQEHGATSPDGQQERSTIQLVRDIASDTATLVRKEVQLARQEIMTAVTARLKASGAFAAAGAMVLFALIYFGIAGGAALSIVLPRWLAWLIVGGAFILLAGMAALVGLRKLKHPPMAPEETKRTVKEDVEWAKAQLRR
jgi:Putative Actinobacterial Holin-X, holin superfamily III